MATALQIIRSFFPDVKRVVNAKQDLTLEITKRDTQKGKTKNHNGCVIAEACKSQLDFDDAIIARRTAFLIRNNVATRFSIPEHVTREIISFDRGGAFAPGSYDLRVPKKVKPREAGARRPNVERPGNSKPQKRQKTMGVRCSLKG